MVEKPSLSDQRIIECLKTDYGIKVATLAFLPLGADMQSSVYRVEADNQSSYFIKLKRGHRPDISAIIIALLHNAGIQQVIPIVKTIRGQPTQRIEGFTLTVSPFIEGQNGFSRDLTNENLIPPNGKRQFGLSIPILILIQAAMKLLCSYWYL
jgi:spectinomycin phosphotransferase